MDERYKGDHFVFGVNSPWARRIYGEGVVEDSCVIFQKENGVLVPRGNNSKEWMTVNTDNPPRVNEAIEYFLQEGIGKVFTVDMPLDGSELWGLLNTYTPGDWNYEEDPWPPAEIYFAKSGGKWRGGFLDLEGKIEIIYLTSEDLYLKD